MQKKAQVRTVGALVLTAMAICMPVAAQAQNRTIRFSTATSIGHPVTDGVKAMTACMSDKSSGKLRLNAFYSGSLGGDVQSIQSLRSGTLEMMITSTSPLVGIFPAMGVFDLPFIFNSEAQADKVLDGSFGSQMLNKLSAAGLVGLAYWENGFRHLTNSRRSVRKLEDLSGLKIRVIQNKIFLDTFSTIGANAVAMPFPEVLPALETKAIDGQENSVVSISAEKIYEHQKFLTLTQHAYSAFVLLFSKSIWDGYSSEEQAILQECALAGRDVQRRVQRGLHDASLAKLKQEGVEITELSVHEQARMRDAVKPVYDRHTETVGRETVRELKAAVEQAGN